MKHDRWYGGVRCVHDRVTCVQIKMAISRRRRLFGAPVKFTDSIVKEDDSYSSTFSIASQAAPEAELHRRERSVAVQASARVTDSSAQTNWSRSTCVLTSHSPLSGPIL